MDGWIATLHWYREHEGTMWSIHTGDILVKLGHLCASNCQSCSMPATGDCTRPHATMWLYFLAGQVFGGGSYVDIPKERVHTGFHGSSLRNGKITAKTVGPVAPDYKPTYVNPWLLRSVSMRCRTRVEQVAVVLGTNPQCQSHYNMPMISRVPGRA